MLNIVKIKLQSITLLNFKYFRIFLHNNNCPFSYLKNGDIDAL